MVHGSTEQDLGSKKYFKERFLINFQFCKFSTIFKHVDSAELLGLLFYLLIVNLDEISFP